MIKQYKTLSLHLFTLLLLLTQSVEVQAQANPNDVNLSPIASERLYVKLGSNGTKAEFTFVNYGSTPVTSFHYTFTEDGKLLEEKDTTLSKPIPIKDSGKLTLHVSAGKKYGLSNLVLTITKVNGYDNRATFNFTTLERATVTKIPKKRVVIEDFTATWCQYCPRATALMEHLAHKYPDTFIGIAAHSTDDPMYCSDYQDKYRLGASGLPTVLLNRSSSASGFTGENEYQNELRKGSDVAIEISAMWDKDKKNIDITTEVTFCLDDSSNKNYALAYVLTADGLKGKGSGWIQANNFSGEKLYLGISKYLDYYINSNYYVHDVTYNHVAIMGEGVIDGIPGSIKAPATANETQTHHATLRNIDNYSVIQDKSTLHAIALLINTKTHRIVNAAKCNITEHTATGINEISSTQQRVKEVARYTVDGRCITTPVSGINIIKYSDGTTRKQIFK